MNQQPSPLLGHRATRTFYWSLAGVLIALGVLTFAWQLVVLGLTLFALPAFHDRRLVFWPVLAAVLALQVSLLLLTPEPRCTHSEGARVQPDGSVVEFTSMRCSGIALWPRMVVAPVAAVGTASIVWLVLRRRSVPLP